MSSSDDDCELGHNISLHYEGGDYKVDNETFIRRTFNKAGKDKHERIFKSSGYIMLGCFILAGIMLIIFSVVISSMKDERAILDANDIAVGSFVNWRLFLYKAELVVTPLVMCTSKIKNYNMLMISWLIYVIIWLMGIVNCIIGYHAIHALNFK